VRVSLWLAMASAFIVSSTLDRSPVVGAAPSPQAQDGRPLFAVSSELVVLHVTVRDHTNRYLDGLAPDEFTVTENGRPQPLRFFLHEDAPATIGLLIDNSGTMQPNRDLVLAAATTFAGTSNPQDDMFALAFNEEVRPALGADAPFTGDPGVLRNALRQAVTARGRTALYDAIARGLEYVEKGGHDRKVLVIVTDGADNASLESFEHVRSLIQSSNVIVYAVAIVDPVNESPAWKRLREFADNSGGELFRPNNVKQVNDVLQRIAQEIRHTYVMAYEPAASLPDGPRAVRVKVRGLKHEKITVRRRADIMPVERRDPPRGQTHVR
jgi:Ca-activated chloride channel family protein